jgi:hypothetical protein
MASRNQSESVEHANLIKMMLNYFTQNGYSNIKADLQGYTASELVLDGRGNNFLPDLTCNKNDAVKTRIILEAETCSTISDSHTADQWRAFARATGEFHIVVPKTCNGQSGRTKAQDRLRGIGITAEQIWTPS